VHTPGRELPPVATTIVREARSVLAVNALASGTRHGGPWRGARRPSQGAAQRMEAASLRYGPAMDSSASASLSRRK
jgi:hypothetical protein